MTLRRRRRRRRRRRLRLLPLAAAAAPCSADTAAKAIAATIVAAASAAAASGTVAAAAAAAPARAKPGGEGFEQPLPRALAHLVDSEGLTAAAGEAQPVDESRDGHVAECAAQQLGRQLEEAALAIARCDRAVALPETWPRDSRGVCWRRWGRWRRWRRC